MIALFYLQQNNKDKAILLKMIVKGEEGLFFADKEIKMS